MAVTIDIFNPQVSTIAKGLAGKSLFIYGGNNVGKTFVATRLSKPYMIMAESGLNAQSNVKFNRFNKWSDINKVIKQFTDPATVDKARAMYDTIVIDEVYAVSLLCQDYIISTYGDGALTLGDSEGKINLYQQYEKVFFKAINKLLSCDYTVVFIGHAVESKSGQMYPKGDKRCLNPIIDNCDFTIYVESNGVDEKGDVIKSSAYLAETKDYFARSRFEGCPTKIETFTAETLEAAINEAVEKTAEMNDATTVTFAEQKATTETAVVDYDETMAALKQIGQKMAKAGYTTELTEIVEGTLGVGKRVVDCTKKQIEAMVIILDALKEKAAELGLEV